MNRLLMILALLLPRVCLAEVPHMSAFACTEATGNESTDRATAKAMAKGMLVLDLNSTVTASEKFETVTTESEDSLEVSDRITKSVISSGKQQLRGVQTIESYYTEFNGIRHYCVTLVI